MNRYVVRIVVGNETFHFCGVDHFQSNVDGAFPILCEAEIQQKNKDDIRNLSKDSICYLSTCKNSCSTFIHMILPPNHFLYFCKSSHLCSFIGLLSTNKFKALVNKHDPKPSSQK